MLAADYVVIHQVQDEVDRAERYVIQSFIDGFSNSAGVSRQAAVMTNSVVGPWLLEFLFKSFNANVDVVVAGMLGSYAFAVAWFPALLALMFCRRGARRHFAERKKKR